MAAPKFLFLKSELILCNIFFPFFLFCFWCTGSHWSLSGGLGQMHLSRFLCKPSTVSPFSDSVSTPRCGAAERRTSLTWVNHEDHQFVIRLPSRSHTRTFGACLSPSVSLLLCGSKPSVGVWNLNGSEMMSLTPRRFEGRRWTMWLHCTIDVV